MNQNEYDFKPLGEVMNTWCHSGCEHGIFGEDCHLRSVCEAEKIKETSLVDEWMALARRTIYPEH